MSKQTHKTEGENRTQTVRLYPFVFTGNDPRKGWRIPLNEIKYNEQHDEETSYGYCDENQPHAVRRIFDDESHQLFDLRWDEAGNLGQVSMSKPGEMFEAGRFLFWTEDCCGPRPCGANRMHTAVDDRYYSYYAYDHSGGSCASREQSQACLSYAEMEQRRRSQRRLKLVGVDSSVDVNAEYMTAVSTLNEPTLYPSSYMVLTNKGYTNVTEVESRASSLALPRCSNVTERKHYYAVTEWVAARLGGGGLNAMGNAIGYSDTLLARADTLFGQSLEQVNSRALNGNDIDCILGNGFAKEEFGHPIDGIPCQMQAGVDFFHDPFKDMVHSMLDDSHNGQEREVYFYHSDHLGSASWITDSGGQAIQHLQYLPYGEPYINQRTSGYNERYTFTGKERDEETGYGYFGARYMDHEILTSFLSVDRYTDKYPSISPYAYCAWNPIKLTDPSGDTIRPAPCSSPEFVAQFNMAIQYLVDNGANGVYSRLQSNPTIIYVSEVDFKDAELISSNPKSKNIEWCPTAGVYTTEGVMMSPTTVLEHEFDHMLQSFENPTQQDADYKNKVDFYGNLEEVRVIDGSEQTTACRLGEIKDGQFTRKNHAGNFYEVLSSTSTTLKNPSQPLKKPSVMPRNLPGITIKITINP